MHRGQHERGPQRWLMGSAPTRLRYARAELCFGVAKSGSERNQSALDKFLAPLEVAPFDDAAMRRYGKLCAHLEARGAPIAALDLLIAAHALALGSVLVTNNQKEFQRVPGLKLENWAKA